MTVVGVTAGQLTVERAMVATLQKWLPLYVVTTARRYAAEVDMAAEVEAELQEGVIPFRPRSVSVSSSFEDWLIEAIPAIQVLSPSWESAGGDQTGMTIKYQLQVACVVGAQTQETTRLIRAYYEDAIVGAVKQHPSLGGLADGVDVVGGGSQQFDEVSDSDSRTFQGSITVFEATVSGVLQPSEGPQSEEPLPDEGVPPPWPADPVLGEDGAEATLEAEELT